MMGLIKERKRQFVKVSAQFMERLVCDYGNAAVVSEMLFYFCWGFRLLYCEDEGVGRVVGFELLHEIE
jgi:hypothetical protein